MSEPDARHDADEATFSSERAKAFVDAVVAIAMTLLILPLVELVSGGDEGTPDAGAWLAHNRWPLISFVFTFILIAMFWMNHHRLFSIVDRVSNALLWLNVFWLMTIVWLPVATALIGGASGDREDPVAALLYIGTMIVTSALMLGMRLYLRAHPAMHGATESAIRGGIAVDLSMILLFAIALILVIASPFGYWAMFVMALTGPLQALFARLLHANRPRSAASEPAR